jgi:hypothetical protein
MHKSQLILAKSQEQGGADMGGMGSGNWYRWQGKKSTVEESLALSMKDLRKRLYAGAYGSITWT